MDLQQTSKDTFMLLILQTLNKIMILPYVSNDLFHSHAYICVCIYIIHVCSITVYSVSVILPLSCSSPSSHRRTL